MNSNRVFQFIDFTSKEFFTKQKELPVEMMLDSIGFSNSENGFQPMQKAAECILSQFNVLYTNADDFRKSFHALKEIA